MPEPFFGLVLGVGTTVGQIIWQLNEYYAAVKSVPRTIRALRKDVECLQRVLSTLKDTIEAGWGSEGQQGGCLGAHWQDLSSNVTEGQAVLKDLEEILESVNKTRSWFVAMRRHRRFRRATIELRDIRRSIYCCHQNITTSLAAITMWQHLGKHIGHNNSAAELQRVDSKVRSLARRITKSRRKPVSSAGTHELSTDGYAGIQGQQQRSPLVELPDARSIAQNPEDNKPLPPDDGLALADTASDSEEIDSVSRHDSVMAPSTPDGENELSEDLIQALLQRAEAMLAKGRRRTATNDIDYCMTCIKHAERFYGRDNFTKPFREKASLLTARIHEADSLASGLSVNTGAAVVNRSDSQTSINTADLAAQLLRIKHSPSPEPAITDDAIDGRRSVSPEPALQADTLRCMLGIDTEDLTPAEEAACTALLWSMSEELRAQRPHRYTSEADQRRTTSFPRADERTQYQSADTATRKTVCESAPPRTGARGTIFPLPPDVVVTPTSPTVERFDPFESHDSSVCPATASHAKDKQPAYKVAFLKKDYYSPDMAYNARRQAVLHPECDTGGSKSTTAVPQSRETTAILPRSASAPASPNCSNLGRRERPRKSFAERMGGYRPAMTRYDSHDDQSAILVYNALGLSLCSDKVDERRETERGCTPLDAPQAVASSQDRLKDTSTRGRKEERGERAMHATITSFADLTSIHTDPPSHVTQSVCPYPLGDPWNDLSAPSKPLNA